MTSRASSCPTPLYKCAELSTASAELWIKNDGLTHAVYGGNKVRKLEPLLAEARLRGAERVLTFGAAGSHHVLTSVILARELGLRAAAVLGPQHATSHVVETLSAALAQGLEAIPAPNVGLLPLVAARALRRRDYVIAPGASHVAGAVAYASAVSELVVQLGERGVPAPDVIVVPLGSGGTCAGLLAGVHAQAMETRVRGALVVENPMARALVWTLATAALRRLRAPVSQRLPLDVDGRYVGTGYGVPSAAGMRATELAARLGLVLEPTYTAKAFACALDLLKTPARARQHQPYRVLYWHTLSARPLPTRGAPAESLPAPLRALLR